MMTSKIIFAVCASGGTSNYLGASALSLRKMEAEGAHQSTEGGYAADVPKAPVADNKTPVMMHFHMGEDPIEYTTTEDEEALDFSFTTAPATEFSAQQRTDNYLKLKDVDYKRDHPYAAAIKLRFSFTCGQFVAGLKNSAEFRAVFIDALKNNQPMKFQKEFKEVADRLRQDGVDSVKVKQLLTSFANENFHLELPPLTNQTQDEKLELMLVQTEQFGPPSLDTHSKALTACEENYAPKKCQSGVDVVQFKGYKGAAGFANDTTSIVATYANLDEDLPEVQSFSMFLKNAPEEQQQAFFKMLGMEIDRKLTVWDGQPMWVSTAGATTKWFHVCLRNRQAGPSYYFTEVYKKEAFFKPKEEEKALNE